MMSWKADRRAVVSLLAVGVALVILAFNLVPAQAGDESLGGDEGAFRYIRLLRSRDGFALAQALRGAHSLLGSSRCQALFSDFADSSGRRLQELLDEQGHTGQSHLRRLLFYDAPRDSSCRSTGILAFTHPGSRVVFICGGFREAFALNPGFVEVVIIHESLHTLGLGENPPTSDEITRQVRARCTR